MYGRKIKKGKILWRLVREKFPLPLPPDYSPLGEGGGWVGGEGEKKGRTISILNLVPRGKPNLKIPSFTSGVNQRGQELGWGGGGG
jgi:hypothetical protein